MARTAVAAVAPATPATSMMSPYASRQTINSANVQAAYTAMTQLRSNEGRLLGVKPQVMLCGPSTYFAARALIEAQVIDATSNTLYKLVEIVNVPWLD
ncbi:Mu-like prophage major head subunit gpT family protein [Methylosinus sp. KRF6]|uniref:Mu-like prophage major head subunit gpT family protein n=1 Tax=Methylosinus sp. KRF6 TaxID=2846853 RepID=UPI001C0E2C14|nr:Mu-like prophage major head subunit gpT family protein [Methylosinus sp. KRF6]